VLPAPHPSIPTCSSKVDRQPITDPQGKSGQLLLSPPSLETTLDPGESARGCIVLENRGTERLDIKLTTVDVVPPATAQTGPTFGGSTPWGAGEWITPAIGDATIEPDTLLSIPYEVTVPKDADAGSHDGAIVVTASSDSTASVAIKTGLVSQLGVVVAGEVVRDGELGQRKGPRLVRAGRDAVWAATWSNSGAVTDHVRATLTVRNSLTGKVVERKVFPKARVLRSSGREISLAWQHVPWIGRYTATLKVTTDGGTHTIHYAPAYALPPTWFLVLAAVALALPFGAWYRRRRRALHDAYVSELVELEVEARRSGDTDA
jgi:hypothetical protein